MKAFFFLHPAGPPEKAAYQHNMVALAEGLKELGWDVKGNVNYWKQSIGNNNDYLIRASNFNNLDEFDLVLVSSTLWAYNGRDILTKEIFNLPAKRRFKVVFEDSTDGFNNPSYLDVFRSFDLILKSHFSVKRSNPKNFIPWQFSLTNRLIDYAQPQTFESRKLKILSNYRVNLQLRLLAEEKAMPLLYACYPKDSTIDGFDSSNGNPIDTLFWEQSGRRHYPAYYIRLGSTLVSNAVGGWVEKSITRKQGIAAKFERRLDRYGLVKYPYDRVFQFDSWRFWESLLAGCATIHIDFEKYGAVLPVKPKNGVHYFGIDLDEPAKNLELIKDPKKAYEIGQNGRTWALENYSPKATATRLLNLLNI